MSQAQPGLAHHFDSYEQQKESSSLGMWIFLAQEIMFFGGLFTAYLVYRYLYSDAFAVGSSLLDVKLGCLNTVVLIASSLTMAMAVRSAQIGKKQQIVAFLVLTLVLGGVFLGVKTVEYSAKWDHHLVPGEYFSADVAEPGHVQLFFVLYFIMTGMHALHMIIGMAIILWMIWKARQGVFTPENHNYVEGFGLYWHFVDIIWIFLFPLLYLLGAGGAGA